MYSLNAYFFYYIAFTFYRQEFETATRDNHFSSKNIYTDTNVNVYTRVDRQNTYH